MFDTNPKMALKSAYLGWLQSQPHSTPSALKKCRTLPNQQCVRTLPRDTATVSAQDTFTTSLQAQVIQAIGPRLSGPFVNVSYPPGFNYGITYGPDAYYNPATLQALDTQLGSRPDGQLNLTTADFADLYVQILQAVTFSFSAADQAIMTNEETAAEEQIASVISAFTQDGGTFNNPLPLGGKIQDIINQLNHEFGSYHTLPCSLNDLRNAMANYVNIAGDSFALHNRYYAAIARLNAAITNATTPNGSNGGMQTDANSYYVGYTPFKLPTTDSLIGSLSMTTNAATVSVSLSNFRESSTQVSISGQPGIVLPIANVFELSLNASANYNLSAFTSMESSVEMVFAYPGVTILAATPSPLSFDNTTGWYAYDILQDVVANSASPGSATGYQLQGSEWPIQTTFGEGGTFARLGTFVISQVPTISMIFTNANTSAIASALSAADMSAQIDFLGIFSIGSTSGSYKVQNFIVNFDIGTTTLTFGPPPLSASNLLSAQVAYVLGGVASYPPSDV